MSKWYRAPRPDLPVVPEHPDLYYLKLEPGAPLPPDLPADAQRYRLVRDEDYRDWRGIAGGVALTMAVGGIALTWTGVPKWFAGTVFFGSLVVAVVGAALGATADVPRYIPADGGEYVLAPRSVVAERLGVLAGPPKLSMPTRIMCGLVGTFFIVFLTSGFVGALGDGVPRIDILALVISFVVIGVGAGFCWMALKGEVPFIRPVEIPASPWFHALADPSAPLPDDAPISGGRSGARRDDPAGSVDPGSSMPVE